MAFGFAYRGNSRSIENARTDGILNSIIRHEIKMADTSAIFIWRFSSLADGKMSASIVQIKRGLIAQASFYLNVSVLFLLLKDYR